MAQEKLFENKVKRYLESNGVYNFGTPKQNIHNKIMGYYEKRWGGSQFTKSGLPDMHVVINGVSIELELKAPNGKPSLLQLVNLALINASNSYGFILVETKETADKIHDWIGLNFPEYKDTPVKCFDDLKYIVGMLLKNF